MGGLVGGKGEEGCWVGGREGGRRVREGNGSV